MMYSCRWVPGTLDRVAVSIDTLWAEWSLGEVFRVLGSRTIYDLYLEGRACGQFDGPVAWPLSPHVRVGAALQPAGHD